MINDLILKVGPDYYHYEEGAIDDVSKLLKDRGAKNVLLLHGGISWEKAEPFFENVLKDEDIKFNLEKYRGECSYAEADRVSEIVRDKKIDFILGVGGGKMSDLSLLVSAKTKVPFGLVPTLASNCAPWAALSVMYKENGLSEGKTEHQNFNSEFLVTDPNLIITSPKRYFIAGLADTIVKWYESDMVTSQEDIIISPMVQLSRTAAKICREEIINNYQEAIEDLEKGQVSQVFYNLSEVIFGIAGLVGGTGGKYARNTAAHTVHDAISTYLPQAHGFLHGEKVAYGMMYQLALEGKWDEIDNLRDFYRILELPKSLKDLGIDQLTDKEMEEMTKYMDSKEKIHLLPIEINQEILKETFIKLEEYINK